MKRVFLILLFVVVICSRANASYYDHLYAERFSLERENSLSPLVYYFSSPYTIDKPYPILVLCDGSESKGTIRSALFIRDCLAERIRSLNVGYLTIEKWGIDGNEVDENEFWSHYTRSQRLQDHLKVIHYLEEHPPDGWNGLFIFVGVSEGGPLVTDLSVLCPNTLATINWVGAGDWGWADEFWEFFEHWKKNSFWIRLYDGVPRWLPFSSDIPPSRQEFDVLVQQIIENPTSDLWMGGMTYLYHADAFQKTPIDYSKIRSPFLVVQGTEDSAIGSCDEFVKKAHEAGAPITYFRVNGMDHYIRKRPDMIDQSFNWLKDQLAQTEEFR